MQTVKLCSRLIRPPCRERLGLLGIGIKEPACLLNLPEEGVVLFLHRLDFLEGVHLDIGIELEWQEVVTVGVASLQEPFCGGRDQDQDVQIAVRV